MSTYSYHSFQLCCQIFFNRTRNRFSAAFKYKKQVFIKERKEDRKEKKKNNGEKGDEIQTLMTSGIGPWLLYGWETSFH